MLDKLRIHIAPVGFEIDRVTSPLIENKADRVYLFAHKPDGADAKPYVKEVKRILLKTKISDIKMVYIDMWDIYDALRNIRKIIELERDNNIYINVSTGSKITAIAGVMAAMMFRENGDYIQPYYVRVKKYLPQTIVRKRLKPLSQGINNVLDIPTYKT